MDGNQWFVKSVSPTVKAPKNGKSLHIAERLSLNELSFKKNPTRKRLVGTSLLSCRLLCYQDENYEIFNQTWRSADDDIGDM